MTGLENTLVSMIASSYAEEDKLTDPSWSLLEVNAAHRAELLEQNKKRKAAAMQRLGEFSESEIESAWANVWDTWVEIGRPYLGHDAYECCEVYELAVASAEAAQY